VTAPDDVVFPGTRVPVRALLGRRSARSRTRARASRAAPEEKSGQGWGRPCRWDW